MYLPTTVRSARRELLNRKRKKEKQAAAPEEAAEAAAGGSGSDGRLPERISPRLGRDVVELTLEVIERVLLAQGAPGQFAERRERSHVDAVLSDFAEFGVGMLIVVYIQH